MKVSPVALLSLCSSSAASAFVTLGGAAKLHHHSSELHGSPDFDDFLNTPFPGRNQGREQPSQQKPSPQPKPVMPDTQSARQKPQSPPPQPTSPWIARRTGGRPLQVDNTDPAEQAPKRIDPFKFQSVTETSEKSSTDEPVAKSEPAKVPNETDNSTLEQSKEPDATTSPTTSWKPPVVIGGVDSPRSNVLQTQRRNTPSVRYYKGVNPQLSPPIRRPNVAGGSQGKASQVPPPPATTPPKPRPGPKAWKPTLVRKPKVSKPTAASTATIDAAKKAAEARKAAMAKRQEAAIARKADERESALQVQQRVARLREQRRIEQERKRQERLERAANQEENRRLEQDRKRKELVAREEKRRDMAIQEEELRKEAAAAKLAEASKAATKRESTIQEIPKEPDTPITDSVEPDGETSPTRPDARLPRAYVSGRQQEPPKAAAKPAEARKTEPKSETATNEFPVEPTEISSESEPSTDSVEPDEETSPTRPDSRLPRAYVSGRQQVPPKAAVKFARAVKPVERPLGTKSIPPLNKPAPGASARQDGPEGTSMKPDSRLPIGNVDEQRAKVAARLARSVQPVRPLGYSNRSIPKKSPFDTPFVESGPKRTFMRPDARLPFANVDEQKEKAAKIAARLRKTVQPVRKIDATRDSGKAMSSKAAAADMDRVKTDSDETSTKPDSRLPTRNVVRNMDSAIPNYFGQMNQAGTKPKPAADAKEPIAWVFDETQPPPTLDRMSRPSVESVVESPPTGQVQESPPPTIEEATKAAQEEATKVEQEKLREAEEALRAAEEEAKKLAYERKRIEQEVQLVSEANARRILEIETRAKRESFRKQQALLSARLSMVQNARAQVLKKQESHAKQRALLTARLDMETKGRTLQTPSSLEMSSSTVEQQSETIEDAAAVALQDPIPPQFRVLSAKYMARLEKAAESNPKSLKDEFEKLRIAKDGENDDGDSPYVQ